MEWLTACIALAGIGVVLAAGPVWGLAAYLASLMWYPEYLRINLGVGFSAPRIVLLVLLARCLTERALVRRFRWITLDSLMAASMAVFCATLAVTTPFDRWVEGQSGFLMDTFLVYLAVRLIVVDRASLVMIAKACGVILVPLAIHGVIETYTGRSLYVGLGQYCSWAPLKGMEYQDRYGLNRAMGPQGETIMFGLNFVTFLPAMWLLRHERGSWRYASVPLAGFVIAGVLSTISSGPLMAMVVAAFGLLLEKAKHLVKPLVALVVLGCVAIECTASHHFYYYMGDLGMDPESAWYRARLLDVAIEKLPEYWPYGYGHNNTGWGPEINGMNWTDGVNDYVVHAILYGAGGLALFVTVQAAALRQMVRVARRPIPAWFGSAAWALGCALVGLMIAFWSVSLFGTMSTIYYILIGLMAALDAMSRTAGRGKTGASVSRGRRGRLVAPAMAGAARGARGGPFG